MLKIFVTHIAQNESENLIFLPVATTLCDIAIFVTFAAVEATQGGLGPYPGLEAVDVLILLLLQALEPDNPLRHYQLSVYQF